jgi:translation elongation factor EF-4
MCHGQMIFLLNNKPVDALALIVPRSAEQRVGRMWVKKLREWCPVSTLVVQIL